MAKKAETQAQAESKSAGKDYGLIIPIVVVVCMWVGLTYAFGAAGLLLGAVLGTLPTFVVTGLICNGISASQGDN